MEERGAPSTRSALSRLRNTAYSAVAIRVRSVKKGYVANRAQIVQ